METENVRTLARLLDQKAGDLDEEVEGLSGREAAFPMPGQEGRAKSDL